MLRHALSWRSVASPLVTALLTVLILILLAPRVGFIEMLVSDVMARLASKGPATSAVELVDIGSDPAPYERLRRPGDAPPNGCEIPRRAYAQGAKRLARWGAKVVVFDLMFHRSCPYEDAELAKTFAQAGNVVVAATARVKPGVVGLSPPVKPLAGAVVGAGAPVAHRPNATVRSIPLVVRDDGTGAEYLALSLLGYLKYAGLDTRQVTLAEGKWLEAGGRRVPLLPGEQVCLLPVGSRSAPRAVGADAGSGLTVMSGSATAAPAARTWNVMLVHWAGPENTLVPRHLSDILKMSEADGRSTFAGKAVLIGRMDWDAHWTSMGSMSGPEIQASALQTLLSRDFIQPLPTWLSLLLLSLIAFATAWVAEQFKGLRAVGAIVLLVLAVSVLAFELRVERGLWMYLFLSGCGVLLASVVTLIKSSALLGQFLPDFLGTGATLRPGEVRSLDASLLFADIRGYTTTAENMDSQDMLQMLNLFHSAVEDIIARHGGSVVKTPGDAVLAAFWRDHRRANHATCALRAGQEILANLPALSRAWESSGLGLEFGIGINSGTVAMGLVGKHHLEPTVVGDAVNVAQRLETLTKDAGYPLIFSESVRAQLQEDVGAVSLDEQALKGRQVPVQCYGLPGPAA